MLQVILLLLVIGLIALVAWSDHQVRRFQESAESRRLSAVSAHDQVWRMLVDGLVKDSRERELSLRGEIQALTEALGRSKEYVQVVYPRDANKPLEESPGWYDGKKRITNPSMKVTS